MINALRGHPIEFGIVPAQGSAVVQAELRPLILVQERLPEWAQAEHRTALDRAPNVNFSLPSWRSSTNDASIDGAAENPGGLRS